MNKENAGLRNGSIDGFSTWLVQEGKSENTVKTYRGAIRGFQKWLTDNEKNINSIEKNDVQAYIDYLELQKRSASTIEKVFTSISVFVRYLGKPYIIQDIQKKEKSKINQVVPESLDRNEQNLLLQKVKQDNNLRNIAIVYTLLHTGIRIAELCSLNRSDIKIIDNKWLLSIREKNGEVERVIPLSQEAQYYLVNYIRSSHTVDDALFVSNVNKRISSRAVQYMLRKYSVNPYKLRHTFCQELVDQGIDLSVVSKLAGHSDINVTKRYVTLLSNHLEDAIKKTFA